MSKITDAEANATSLDGLVNDNALVPTLRNGPKPSYQYLVDGWNTEFNTLIDNLDTQGDAAIVAINEDVATVESLKNSATSLINSDVTTVDSAATVALSSINTNKETIETAAANVDLTIAELDSKYKLTMLGVDGAWASGIEFTAYNQYLVYNGTAYQPKPSTNLPYTTGATPNLSDVQPVTVNSADGIILDGGGSVQDFISDRDEVEALEVYTIGLGGDFTSINEAIKKLHNKTSFLKSGQVIELNQLSGFTMQEQLFANAIDLSMFNITSVDPVVTIDRQYLTETIPTLDYNSTPAFLAVNGGKLPIISTLYEMNTTGTSNINTQHGVMVAWGGFARVNVDCGIINCTGRGFYGVNGIMYGRRVNFSGAGTYGCRPGNGSLANVRDSNFSNCGDSGLYVAASHVVANFCDLSGAGNYAYQGIQGAFTSVKGCDLSNAGKYAVYVRGGEVDITDTNMSGFAERGVQAQESSIVKGRGISVSNTNADRVFNAVQCSKVLVSDVSVENSNLSAIAGSFLSSEVSLSEVTNTANTYSLSELFVGSKGKIVVDSNNLTTNVTPNRNTSSGIIETTDIIASKGTATILSGNGAVTVNHGLTVTPSTSDIYITPINTDASESSWRVGSVNGTSFTIGVSVQAVSDLGFAWGVDVK